MSDERIERFAPRPSPARSSRPGEPLVWAITDDGLPRQMLPRDCPRVYAELAEDTSLMDALSWMGGFERVVWIDDGWLDRCASATLYLHRMRRDGFTLEDAPAGYHVSSQPAVVTEVIEVDDCLAWLAEHGVDIRPVHDLATVAESVMATTLTWSTIRLDRIGH